MLIKLLQSLNRTRLAELKTTVKMEEQMLD